MNDERGSELILDLLDFKVQRIFGIRVNGLDNEIYAAKKMRIAKQIIEKDTFLTDQAIQHIIAHKQKLPLENVLVQGFTAWITL